jgi:hypothetical protein
MWHFVAAISSALVVAGCATAVRGTTERFDVHTEPPGVTAKFIITPVCDTECLREYYPDTAARIGDRAEATTAECVTPCMITPARSSVITVNFTKAGYEPRTVVVRPRVGKGAVAVAGNAIIGGATGVPIDAASGASLDHCPNPLIVKLVPAGSRLPEPPIGTECLLRPEDDTGARPAYRN